MVTRNLWAARALVLLGAALVAPLLPLSAATAVTPPGLLHGGTFDVQAHRGGIGLTVESSLAAFDRAIRLGVSTLELDVQITQDGQAVVTHDRQVSRDVCRDTAPAAPVDLEFPYVGKYVNTLTLAQVRTLDCGSTRKPGYPDQRLAPGSRMALLGEVFDLVRAYRADGLVLNVETKVEAGAPSETAPREQFVQVVADEVRAAGIADQVTVQSFDWGSLMRMHEVLPELPLVALTNGDFLQVGQPGGSPWLGGIDVDDFGGDLVRAADSFGADAISPVADLVTRRMVRDAHRSSMSVVPWTVNDPATMASLVRLGVDGLVTDYPDRLRRVLARSGHRLPQAYDAPRQARPLAGAHAHNDYEHDRPLRDALDHGFTSVEADVWLVDGELRVAHDLDQVQAGRTLERLYLSPLQALTTMNRGAVYPGWDGSLQLLIDAKSEATTTYAAIDAALRNHPGLTTTFTASTTTPGAVTAVISGNRDLTTMLLQPDRRAGYDGRLADLVGLLPASVMPLVSESWSSTFTWDGTGPMPGAERTLLRTIVSRAHEQGYRVRFWATPDEAGPARTAVWRELRAAGVDHLNTDDLAGLQRFLLD